MTTPRYALLIPVKDGRNAKSRLGVGSDDQRALLMAAFAHDSISAALACPQVKPYVVGDAANLSELLEGLDVEVLPDLGAGDLNRALQRAALEVGSPQRPVAVMLADLPCLRTDDLSLVFSTAPPDTRSFVPDASGHGTTILIAPEGIELDPRFGTESAREHQASGAVAIGIDVPSVRMDVDTTSELQSALAFGVGRATEAAARLV